MAQQQSTNAADRASGWTNSLILADAEGETLERGRAMLGQFKSQTQHSTIFACHIKYGYLVEIRIIRYL